MNQSTFRNFGFRFVRSPGVLLECWLDNAGHLPERAGGLPGQRSPFATETGEKRQVHFRRRLAGDARSIECGCGPLCANDR